MTICELSNRADLRGLAWISTEIAKFFEVIVGLDFLKPALKIF